MLRFFDARSGGERLGRLEAHQGGVNIVRYVPGGKTILSGGDDGTVREWDAATARQLRVIPLGGRVHLLAVSANGACLATGERGSDASVSVWDLATGIRRQHWSATDDIVGTEALAFSVDGETLLTFDHDHGLRVLEVETGAEREVEQPRFGLGPAGLVSSWTSRGLFAPGNHYLAVSTATTAFVAELATGAE